jgi:capsular polysaccharide transport system permease protein
MIGEVTAGGGEERRSFGEWFVEHSEIVLILAWRDFKTRFSQNFFGYSWNFVTPLLWVSGTYLFFHFMGRTSPVYTDLITFIISGLIPFASFRYAVNAMGRVNGTVRGLLIFPTVTAEHAAIAGALVEYCNIFILFAIVSAINHFAFGNGELDNPLMWLEGITLAWALGASYGYFFSVLSRRDVTIFQLGVILLRPSYFFSAVFFIPNELTGDVLKVFSWNPLLHAVEIARDGMLFHYESRVADPLYVIVCIAVLFGAALAVRAWRAA